MKKIAIIFISMLISMFSMLSFANDNIRSSETKKQTIENRTTIDSKKVTVEDIDINTRNNIFGSKNNEDTTQHTRVLSENRLNDTKGGAKSYQFICSKCGAFHGGVYSPNVCYNCYNKGAR